MRSKELSPVFEMCIIPLIIPYLRGRSFVLLQMWIKLIGSNSGFQVNGSAPQLKEMLSNSLQVGCVLPCLNEAII